MNVYAEVPPDMSKAMDRVVRALKTYAPWDVKFTTDPKKADMSVLHVIGYPETIEAVLRLIDTDHPYVIIQYCMRSTQKPNTHDWQVIWSNASLVWTYYDLYHLCSQDGSQPPTHLYISPLGADPIFSRNVPHNVKMYTMLTSGYVAESETVNEVAAAIKRINGQHFHLGPMDVAPEATHGFGISDRLLADVYSRTCWVAGLRRAEGFEMPAAEGLCAGARPICFDAPHYRNWFGKWAQFIPEAGFDETVEALVNVFQEGWTPPTEDERHAAAEFFSWERIVTGFWERIQR